MRHHFYASMMVYLALIMGFSSHLLAQEDFWIQTGGPGEGGFSVAAENSSGHIYVVNLERSLYRSLNSGQSWEKIIKPNGSELYSIVIDSADRIYCGTFRGLYWSDDSGSSWQRSTQIQSPVEALALNSDDHIFVAVKDSCSYRSIYHLDNQDDIWSHILQSLEIFDDGTEDCVLHLEIDNLNNIYCYYYSADSEYSMMDGTILRSNNNGQSWTDVEYPGGYLDGLCAGNNGLVLAGSAGDDVLYRSTDYGDIWVGLTQYPGIDAWPIAINSQGTIFASSNHPNLPGFYRSNDIGDSWDTLNFNGMPFASPRALFINSEDHIFAGKEIVCETDISNYGILKSSDNCDTWVESDTGFPPNQFVHSLGINSVGSLFALSDRKLYTSSTEGDTWEYLVCPEVDKWGEIMIDSGDRLYLYSSASESYRSDNTGIDWEPLGLSNLTCMVEIYGGVLVAHEYVGGGLYQSLDQGDNWELMDIPTSFDVTCMSISPVGDLLVGGVNNLYQYQSQNNTWFDMNEPCTPKLAVSNSSGSAIFVSGYLDGECLFKSLDNGLSWTEISHPSPGNQIYRLVPNSQNELYAVICDTNQALYWYHGYGIYRSHDSGETWVELNEGLSDLDVMTLIFNSEGVAFAGTSHHGVFRSLESTTAFDDGMPILSHSLKLQTFPNPFNPVTTISYDLPEHSEVTLTVYDVTGREMVTLQNEEHPAGHYEVRWNGVDDSGNQVSTGVYFARLQAGNYSKTIKMVLLR